MSASDTFVPKCGHPCRYLIEHQDTVGPSPKSALLNRGRGLLQRARAARRLWQRQRQYRMCCCRCGDREPCSVCAPFDTPEDKRRRDEYFEIGRKFAEEVWDSVVQDVTLRRLPDASAPPARSGIHWGRGFRRLGAVLGVTLSLLVGLLLWAIGLGIVFVWLIGLAALAWAAVRAARWVLAGFRADSDDTVDARGPKGK